jgi:hypothetical protein
MTNNKKPSLGRKGARQNSFIEHHSTLNLSFHPSTDRPIQQLELFTPDPLKPQNIRSVGIEPNCKHCGCKRGYLYKGKLLCCRCDRPVKGGSK